MAQRTLVRTYVAQFAVLSVVALLVLSAATYFASRRIAENEALREAETRAVAIAHNIASPLVSDKVRSGDERATRDMGRVLTALLNGKVLRHIKVWDDRGRVVWSDEVGLVGDTYPLPRQVEKLFGSDRTVVEISGHDRGENRYEADEEELLEVYAGARDADGEPFVLETYTSSERMNDSRRTVLRQLLPHAGERTQALLEYADLRTHMLEELGVEPGPATQDLYVAILRDDGREDHRRADRTELGVLVRLLREALESGVRVDRAARASLSEVGAMMLEACGTGRRPGKAVDPVPPEIVYARSAS